jgi:hypothetical protein
VADAGLKTKKCFDTTYLPEATVLLNALTSRKASGHVFARLPCPGYAVADPPAALT